MDTFKLPGSQDDVVTRVYDLYDDGKLVEFVLAARQLLRYKLYAYHEIRLNILLGSCVGDNEEAGIHYKDAASAMTRTKKSRGGKDDHGKALLAELQPDLERLKTITESNKKKLDKKSSLDSPSGSGRNASGAKKADKRQTSEMPLRSSGGS